MAASYRNVCSSWRKLRNRIKNINAVILFDKVECAIGKIEKCKNADFV